MREFRNLLGKKPQELGQKQLGLTEEALIQAALHRLESANAHGNSGGSPGTSLLDVVALASVQAPVVLKTVLTSFQYVQVDSVDGLGALLELGRLLCEQSAISQQQLWQAIEPDGMYHATVSTSLQRHWNTRGWCATAA